MIFNLSENNSIANHFISEMRNVDVQKDSARFRKNLERLGEILAYEISKTFNYERVVINTPLAVIPVNHLTSQPVLAGVMRAGLPMVQGFLNFFDKADCAFLGAYRGPHKDDYSFDVSLDYISAPDLTNRNIILIDPMIATGKSLLSAYTSLLKYGKPSSVNIAGAIAAQDGLDLLVKNIPELNLWIGAIDPKLNSKYYIVPGLGDAGDLAFGVKV